MVVTSRPVLETYDPTTGQMYRHSKAYGRRWSSYYGEAGGGFGLMTWKEDRAIGPDYPDVGFLYPVKLRKGLTQFLFDGLIVDIEEIRGKDKDTLVVTAAGKGVVFEHDAFNRVYRESRTNKWTAREANSGSFVPDKFDYNLQEQVYLRPRRGVDYRGGEFMYVRYSVPFGDYVEKIGFSTVVELPNSWPGKFEVRDNTGVLWSSYETYSGEHILAANDDASYIEARFTVTEWGENAAEDGTVYGQLAGVWVSSGRPESTLTAREVALDVIEALEEHGISQNTSLIQRTYRELPSTVAFETDQKPKDVMTWCCKFGAQDDALLAWGVELDDEARVYLGYQDLETIRYVIRRNSGLQAQVRGSFGKSAQKLYVVYTDQDGQVQRTADFVDQDRIEDQGGLYRRIAYRVSGNIDAATAAEVGALRLAEDSRPATTTSFSVTDRVYTATGKAIAIDEIQAGGMVVVSDFRSAEAAGSADDIRSQWTSFQLVGVEIDEDGRTARLIPAGDRKAFERLLSRLSAEQQAGM